MKSDSIMFLELNALNSNDFPPASIVTPINEKNTISWFDFVSQ